MQLYGSLGRIENVVVPVLTGMLTRVREHKEKVMADDRRYKCPLCDFGEKGDKTKRAVNIHLGTGHKDVPKEERPAPIEVGGESPEMPTAAEPGTEPQPPTQEPPVPERESKPVSPEDAPQPPSAAPPFPPPDAPQPHPTSITPGSALLLNGPAWQQNPATKAWEAGIADQLTVQVLKKELSTSGDVVLICRAEKSSVLWSVQEELVLKGIVKLLYLAPGKPHIESEAARPEDGPRNISDPEHNYFEKQRKAQELRQQQEAEREDYGTRLRRYTDANRRKKSAEKEFEAIREEDYEKLKSYVKKYGEPSGPGKDDWMIVDFDYKAHIVRRPGDSGVKLDTEVIVQWLRDHDMEECLNHTLNITAWETAKKEGKVPADFVREVEEPYKDADDFQFRIDPL